jgi:uncharacterized UBP type Zn finger protein
LRQRLRSSGAAVDPRHACEHLAEAQRAEEPLPQTPGRCQDCEELGELVWAHLRMCLTCGHVGCCDSSPHKHATAHFHQTGHPLMRSVEPGEDWRWCYVHVELGGGHGE